MGLYEAQYIKKGTEDKNIMLKYDGNEMELNGVKHFIDQILY